jgi:hypothetical protein
MIEIRGCAADFARLVAAENAQNDGFWRFVAPLIRGSQIRGHGEKDEGQLAQLEAFIPLRGNVGKDLTIERHATSE